MHFSIATYEHNEGGSMLAVEERQGLALDEVLQTDLTIAPVGLPLLQVRRCVVHGPERCDLLCICTPRRRWVLDLLLRALHRLAPPYVEKDGEAGDDC